MYRIYRQFKGRDREVVDTFSDGVDAEDALEIYKLDTFSGDFAENVEYWIEGTGEPYPNKHWLDDLDV